jgi:hypothetical protein
VYTPTVRRTGLLSWHAAANGAAEVTVRITPRAEDGSPRAATAVTVTLRGQGTLTQAARPAGEGWEARIVAPRAPGSTLIDVSIDGVTVGVHPRVWWD